MTRGAKDREIAAVAAQLDKLLDQLAESVDALNGILTRPGPPGQGSDDERLAAQ